MDICNEVKTIEENMLDTYPQGNFIIGEQYANYGQLGLATLAEDQQMGHRRSGGVEISSYCKKLTTANVHPMDSGSYRPGLKTRDFKEN